MLFRVLTSLVKIVIASLIAGALLTHFDLSAEQLLLEIGLTPESVLGMIRDGFDWAMPNIILGSLVIVPIWLVIYLFKPPQG